MRPMLRVLLCSSLVGLATTLRVGCPAPHVGALTRPATLARALAAGRHGSRPVMAAGGDAPDPAPVAEADEDGNGELDFDEFLHALQHGTLGQAALANFRAGEVERKMEAEAALVTHRAPQLHQPRTASAQRAALARHIDQTRPRGCH